MYSLKVSNLAFQREIISTELHVKLYNKIMIHLQLTSLKFLKILEKKNRIE